MVFLMIKEVSYRRGFVKGYNKGIDQLNRLISDGRTPEEALKICQKFLNEELDYWRITNPQTMIEPPNFDDWMKS